MSWEAWFALFVLAAIVIALMIDLAQPAAVVFGGLVVLLLSGVLEASEALTGFGNPAPATVAAFYVVAGGVERTGLVHRLVEGLMGQTAADRGALARLVVPTAVASSVFNNTPIVAMAVPALGRWTARAGRPLSALLMPLSFAAILGGMVTVIGTSTHIVVSGLLVEAGYEPFGFFEVAKVGLPIAVVGIVILIGLAPVLLPERRSARSDVEDAREYTVEMVVVPDGPVDGATVAEASLRHLAGVFLAQVERDGDVVGLVGPDFVLKGLDTLRFVGNAQDVTDLHERPGLAPAVATDGMIHKGRLAFFEAVVGVGSALSGTSLRSIGFRDRFQGVVLAIHRADRRVAGKLGEVRLKVGDTLLVLAPASFRSTWAGSGEFAMITRLDSGDPFRSTKRLPAFTVAATSIALAATGATSFLEAALIGAFGMVITGVVSSSEARRSVNLDVVVLIAASFGIGVAIVKTGLAGQLADTLVSATAGAPNVVVFATIAIMTMTLTELVTNNGAAVLALPIGLAVANEVGLDQRTMAVVVSVAASASFLTPIGYQTNTMVWGPGGYRFSDYSRLGIPLTLTTLAVVAIVSVV